MRIFTSSWFSRLPPTIQRIGISRGTPRNQTSGYRMMRELAPGAWFKSTSPAQYTHLYMEQLGRLDHRVVLSRMEDLSAGRDVALLCFEPPGKPDAWCHRGHVSAWLMDVAGIQVFEFGHEKSGCGWAHPKLPAQFRKLPDPTPIDVTPYLGRTAVDANGRTWKVTGRNPELPNQALIENPASGDVRSISKETLEERFGAEPKLI